MLRLAMVAAGYNCTSSATQRASVSKTPATAPAGQQRHGCLDDSRFINNQRYDSPAAVSRMLKTNATEKNSTVLIRFLEGPTVCILGNQAM